MSFLLNLCSPIRQEIGNYYCFTDAELKSSDKNHWFFWKPAAEVRQGTEMPSITEHNALLSSPALTGKGVGDSIWCFILLFLHTTKLIPMMNFCVDTPTSGLILFQFNNFSSICVLLAEGVCEISSYFHV